MNRTIAILTGAMLGFLPILAVASGDDAARLAAEQAKQQTEQARQMQHMQQSRAQLEQQLQEAQEKLRAAAQRVAQLSLQLSGPDMDRRELVMLRHMHPDHAILGITIVDHGKHGVHGGNKGVTVSAVTPGGPAESAGLSAGDVITAINGKTFKGHGEQSTDDQLLAFMETVKPGDKLTVSYLHDGKSRTATLKAGKLDMGSFDFAFDMPPMPPVPPSPPSAPTLPAPPAPPNLAWFINTDQPWSDMQLVPLTPALGQYFGTDKGLLVVHVAKRHALKLQDGDVILSIGGRDPGSPPHAMRILRSYNPGETVRLEIMRKGKPVKFDIKLPDTAQPGSGDISALYREFQFGPAFLHFGIE